MLNILAECIVNKWDLPWADFGIDDGAGLSEFCNDVLSCVENNGMNPPEYTYWNSKNPQDMNERGIPKDLQHSSWNGDKFTRWEEE